MDIQAKILLKT